MRLVSRLLALLLGLALVAAGTIVLVECVLRAVGRPPWLIPAGQWQGALSNATWTTPWVLASLVGALVAGLLLLALALWPRTPKAIPLREEAADRSVELDRRGLQEHLRQVATGDDDVVAATVRARRSKAKVSAELVADADRRATSQRLQQRLQAALDELGPEKRYRPDVTTRQAAERVR